MLAAAWTTNLPTWIALALAVAVAWRISRGGGGSAVSELSRANEVLTRRVHELGDEVRDLRVENEHLRSRTDFAQALAPVLEGLAGSAQEAATRQEAIMGAQAQHEDRAQSRQAGILKVLDLIAGKLGAEPELH